ncbi:MAG: GatB/YqeY domain-containing protein [Deltaproteobacteria bacterium]|nr:GatB/YqeY domain-containing protein [Deltaproteobacteria bacterium]
MAITERIESDMVKAAKAKDKGALSAIRMIKTALHNREIDLKRSLDDGETLQVLSSLVKQRRDSIEQFGKGGRQDLVEKEERELAIIQGFMPDQMSETEISAIVEKAVAEVGAVGMKDMGKVMKALMPAVTGRADGKLVSEMVKKLLSS